MSDRGWALILFAFIAANAGAQTAPPPPAPTQTFDDTMPDDIIVEGYRRRPDLDTTVRLPNNVSVIRNRRSYDDSERMARCALRSRLSDYSWLRKVVDGEFNTARHAYAQDRLKRIYVTCGEGANALFVQGGTSSEQDRASGMAGGQAGISPNVDATPLGRSIYDRGAYTVQVLKRFAPDLSLTRAQTEDPAVQARFNARETARNRFRLPSDYRYFEVAVCMVRVEPRLAVRLARSTGPARFGDVQAALIDRARICVGGAKNVEVDPTQFRLYIADAVYRWAVAARGVDSLIPAA